MLVSAAAARRSWPSLITGCSKVKGKFIRILSDNPHPMMTLEVQANDGKKETWLVGGPQSIRMEANGWTKSTVKPGDVITGISLPKFKKVLRLEQDVGGRQGIAPLHK